MINFIPLEISFEILKIHFLTLTLNYFVNKDLIKIINY